MKIEKKLLLRVIDVNINRAKEGLRVIEDVCRFLLKADSLRKKIRRLRHDLERVVLNNIRFKVIAYRDAKNDLGRKLDSLETKRDSVSNIFYANFSRVKEALRVLEEFSKLAFPKKTAEFKELRYRVYRLEKISLKIKIKK